MSIIEKVDLTVKRRGRTPFLYPILNGELGFIETEKTKNRPFTTRNGYRILDKNCILSVHSIYFRKESNKKEVTHYLYFSDGIDIFRVDYYAFIIDFSKKVSTLSNPLLSLCTLCRETQTPVHELMAFYSL